MATKLPLIARKNIRDEYDAKIPDLLARLKEYTGQDYEFVLNFQELYPTLDLSASYQSESPGSTAYSIYEGFVDKMKSITKDGDDKLVIDFVNQVISTHKVNLLVTDEAKSYSDCRVKDGVLEILFKTGNFGSNASYACDNLEKEIDLAFSQTNKGELPLAAKKGFQEDFLDKKDKLEEDIAEELILEDKPNRISLVADPEAIWKVAVAEFDKLKRSEKGEIVLDDIARNMGSAIYAYFEGFLSTLKYKFKQDDMMVEAFLDSCPSKEVRVVLVPKGGLTRSYNDAIFEDGAYVIRTVPQSWYTNASYACDEIDKQL